MINIEHCFMIKFQEITSHICSVTVEHSTLIHLLHGEEKLQLFQQKYTITIRTELQITTDRKDRTIDKKNEMESHYVLQ